MTEILQLRDRGLEWVDTGTEIIALDATRDTYMAGNGTAKLLWPLLVAGTTRQALVQLLVQDLAVDISVAAADVDVFVNDLRQKALLKHR